MRITKNQQISLARKWHQSNQGMSYLQFRRTIQPTFGSDGAIMVEWCGMFLGIEIDGYCHS
jgi:hypothetical protein